MSSTNPPAPPGMVADPLSLKSLAELLVLHYGLKEGFYEPAVEFLIGTATAGPAPDATFPSAIVSVSRVGLTKVAQETQNSVDAGSVKRPRTRTRKAKNPE